MKKSSFLLTSVFLYMLFVLPACTDDEKELEFPLSATIFNSISGSQVAFTALTHSAVSWLWDFGDGKTSSEKNPVHIYEDGGYYVVSLKATDNSGQTVSTDVTIAVNVTPYVLLTGGSTAENGKTWKLSADHGGLGDYLADAKEGLPTVDPGLTPLPAGAFGQLGMPDAYKGTYTFYYDGRYKHDTEGGSAFGGIVYQFVLNGGVGITNNKGQSYGLCLASYTPKENATFTYTEDEDFDVPTVYGGVKFKGAKTLDFSGTEFVAFRDFQQKVVIKQISDTRMQLIMFMAASDKAIGLNTHALILTLEAVN